MQALTVVVAQADCIVAEHLTALLHSHFKNVVVARDLEEVRHHVHRYCADVAIVDLDLADTTELRTLVAEFKPLRLVCTHRAPDESMWKLCMEIGALDCCCCGDVTAILHAVRHRPHASGATAA